MIMKAQWKGYDESYFWLAISSLTMGSELKGFFVEIFRYRMDFTFIK
jgi:hypothetical protein